MILYKKLNCPSSWLSRHLKWLYPVTTQAWVSGQCNPIQATETLLSAVILPVPFHIPCNRFPMEANAALSKELRDAALPTYSCSAYCDWQKLLSENGHIMEKSLMFCLRAYVWVSEVTANSKAFCFGPPISGNVTLIEPVKFAGWTQVTPAFLLVIVTQLQLQIKPHLL